MKKILFGSAAAVLAVAGLSSYKANQTVYYFKVSDGIAKGSQSTQKLNNGNAPSLTNGSVFLSSPTGCTGIGNLCVVTISASNVITTTTSGTKRYLKTSNFGVNFPISVSYVSTLHTQV